jgi:biopolymer transport protein ExbD
VRLRARTEPINTFGVQSLADIILLLLIFFLLTSTFVLQTGIKVELPRTTVGEPTAERVLIISMAGSGAVYLNQDQVSRAELAHRIRQMLVSREQIVIIRADKTLPLDKVVDVMDVAKTAGASRFLIATQALNGAS